MFYKKELTKKRFKPTTIVNMIQLLFTNLHSIFDLFFDIFKFSIEPSFQSNPTIEPWKVLFSFFSSSFLTPLPSLMGLFNFLRDKVVILFSLLVSVSYSPTLKLWDLTPTSRHMCLPTGKYVNIRFVLFSRRVFNPYKVPSKYMLPFLSICIFCRLYLCIFTCPKISCYSKGELHPNYGLEAIVLLVKQFPSVLTYLSLQQCLSHPT